MKLTYCVPENKKIRVIIDSDTACEADDPFAIAHALMSPKLIVRAVIAEHFAAAGSMQKSYEAIKRLTAAMELDVNVLSGEEWPLKQTKRISEGVKFIIEEARSQNSHPLYILCLGALSNIARALEEAPAGDSVRQHPRVGGKQDDGHELEGGDDADLGGVVVGQDGEHVPVLGDALKPRAGRRDQGRDEPVAVVDVAQRGERC